MYFNKLQRRFSSSSFLTSVAVIAAMAVAVGLAAGSVINSPVMKHRIEAGRALSAGSEFWMFAEKSDLHAIKSVLSKRSRGLPADVTDILAEVILDESMRYGLDPALILAIIATESSFCNWVRSDRNALGLMQILPTTGEAVARKIDIAWEGEASLYLPVVNVRVGTYYFKELVERFDSVELALAAYNRGPSAVHCIIGRGRTPSKKYSRKVLSNYHELRALFSPRTS